jgi:nitrate/nitrite transport system ATP-binding protein
MIELRGVSKKYPSRDVIADINLRVEEGEFVSILGYSGSGKTTLISIAAGLREADAGEVLIEGKPIKGFADEASIVFQNYSLLPWFSALENVRLAVDSRFHDWPVEKQKRQAAKYLELVGLGNAFDKTPKQLSGGMRQRVSIARAFATEPKILFLDEPFGALDALTRGNLQQELARMCASADRPITTLMITNNVEEAILLSDRIIPLSKAPRATLGPSIKVAVPKPRTTQLLAHDPEFVRIQAEIVEFLSGNKLKRSLEEVPA